MNGNTISTVTRGNREALESRISQFHNQYLAAFSPEQKGTYRDGNGWNLEDMGRISLGAILRDSGYLKDGDSPAYRRLSVGFQSREPVIDVLEFRDVLDNKNEGFSYIRLSNLEELDAYTQARDARLKGNIDADATIVGGFGGAILGVVTDIAGLIIALNTDWNPHEAWLLAPPLGGALLGVIIGGILESSGSTKAKEATAFFQKQYQHRITTGPEAILRALNLSYSPALPEGQ